MKKQTIKLNESQLRDMVRESLMETISEKAKSVAQQQFMGMVDAYKKGDMPDASPAIKKAAKGMTKKQVKDFAKTKHKGLPDHVDESIDEISDDTVDNALMKVTADANQYGFSDPKAVRRRAQADNIRKMRDERLGFNPSEMSAIMRQRGTSGDPTIDRRWARWQQNHNDRVAGNRYYNAETGRWFTKELNESRLENIITEAINRNLKQGE